MATELARRSLLQSMAPGLGLPVDDAGTEPADAVSEPVADHNALVVGLVQKADAEREARLSVRPEPDAQPASPDLTDSDLSGVLMRSEDWPEDED